jgi:hypothetical protein
MIKHCGNLVDIKGDGLEFIANVGFKFVAFVHDDLSFGSMA